MKKSRVTAILFSVLMIVAAVFYSVNDTYAGAYTGWGYQLPTGGSDSPSAVDRPMIWGYTKPGSWGNTVVNGTLNTTKETRGYYATAYIDTNVSHDIRYTVTAEICGQHGPIVAIYATNKETQGDTAGIYTSVAMAETITATPHARGCHEVESNLYGTFIGYTRKNY